MIQDMASVAAAAPLPATRRSTRPNCSSALRSGQPIDGDQPIDGAPAIDGGEAGAKRTVQAALLRRCCHELKDQVDPRGLRLRNAVIAGRLDLAGLTVPFPLRFDGCEFDSAPVVEGADLFELALTGCPRLPGLLGNGLRLRRDLDLSGSRVAGRAPDEREHVEDGGDLAVRVGDRRPPALRGHHDRRAGRPRDPGRPDPRRRRRAADPPVPLDRRGQADGCPARRLA